MAILKEFTFRKAVYLNGKQDLNRWRSQEFSPARGTKASKAAKGLRKTTKTLLFFSAMQDNPKSDYTCASQAPSSQRLTLPTSCASSVLENQNQQHQIGEEVKTADNLYNDSLSHAGLSQGLDEALTWMIILMFIYIDHNFLNTKTEICLVIEETGKL